MGSPRLPARWYRRPHRGYAQPADRRRSCPVPTVDERRGDGPRPEPSGLAFRIAYIASLRVQILVQGFPVYFWPAIIQAFPLVCGETGVVEHDPGSGAVGNQLESHDGINARGP